MKYTVGQVIHGHTITSIIEEEDRYVIYWRDEDGVTKYWKDFNKNMAISTENDTTYGDS